MNKQTILSSILDIGIVPVVRTNSAENAVRAVEAIYRGGIRAAEITMTVPGAIKALERVAEGDRLLYERLRRYARLEGEGFDLLARSLAEEDAEKAAELARRAAEKFKEAQSPSGQAAPAKAGKPAKPARKKPADPALPSR